MLYLDSSVLIKHYVREPGTDAVHVKIKQESQPSGIFISDLGYAEILATIGKRVRENLLRQKEGEELSERFLADWLFALGHVELTAGVLGLIPGLLKRHPLRGADAIHLASALWLRDALKLGKSLDPSAGILEFATSDKQLKTAAALEGLRIFDPVNPT